MIEKLQHRFALSERGAKDLVKGVVACAVQNVSFMVPVSLLYFFVGDLLKLAHLLVRYQGFIEGVL